MGIPLVLRMTKSMPFRLRAGFAALLLLGLAACASNEAPPPAPAPAPIAPVEVTPPEPVAPVPTRPARDASKFLSPAFLRGHDAVRVALILPFNSTNARVKELVSSMANAAQLALFEFQAKDVLIMRYDSGTDAAAAAKAGQQAIDQGADIILGPLFASSVAGIAPVASKAQVPVVAFSTDSATAGNGVYLLSFPPDQDVKRIVAYAMSQGLNNFAELVPQGAYGRRASDAFESEVRANGGKIAKVAAYSNDPAQMENAIRSIIGAGAVRQTVATPGADAEVDPGTGAGATPATPAPTLPFNAVFIPDGAASLKGIASLLAEYGVSSTNARFLGTGLWDDPSLDDVPALANGWYPAPPSEGQAQFASRYQQAYGAAPARLAGLAYDAMSLAIVLSRQGGDRFTTTSLTNPDGFAGIDGVFRFAPNGLVERGLAVYEIHPGGATMIDPAPASFKAQAAGY